jgi:hypothetical protein
MSKVGVNCCSVLPTQIKPYTTQIRKAKMADQKKKTKKVIEIPDIKPKKDAIARSPGGALVGTR